MRTEDDRQRDPGADDQRHFKDPLEAIGEAIIVSLRRPREDREPGRDEQTRNQEQRGHDVEREAEVAGFASGGQPGDQQDGHAEVERRGGDRQRIGGDRREQLAPLARDEPKLHPQVSPDACLCRCQDNQVRWNRGGQEPEQAAPGEHEGDDPNGDQQLREEFQRGDPAQPKVDHQRYREHVLPDGEDESGPGERHA